MATERLDLLASALVSLAGGQQERGEARDGSQDRPTSGAFVAARTGPTVGTVDPLGHLLVVSRGADGQRSRRVFGAPPCRECAQDAGDVVEDSARQGLPSALLHALISMPLAHRP